MARYQGRDSRVIKHNYKEGAYELWGRFKNDASTYRSHVVEKSERRHRSSNKDPGEEPQVLSDMKLGILDEQQESVEQGSEQHQITNRISSSQHSFVV